jgi:hypothetical protein
MPINANKDFPGLVIVISDLMSISGKNTLSESAKSQLSESVSDTAGHVEKI